jgi:hypothetical protein
MQQNTKEIYLYQLKIAQLKAKNAAGNVERFARQMRARANLYQLWRLRLSFAQNILIILATIMSKYVALLPLSAYSEQLSTNG